ncbi:putative cytochrome P450 4d14 [Haematobia irritans]
MEQKSFKEDTNETDDPLTRLKERHSLMDQLLLSTIDGKPLTNADIQEEIDTLIFGGQDSTATAVSSILHFLSRHPESQQQVYDEILNVFGNEKDFSIEMDQLQDLKYLECVIKESLRLHPPIPLISRVTSEDTKVGNQIIPAKAMICMSLFNINRDPDLYSSPNEFQPERFMNTSHDETYNPYAFVPFSAGPRKCIGYKFAMLEMKILVSRIVRHYELLPLGPEIVPIASITLSSTTGFNLGLKPRVDV